MAIITRAKDATEYDNELLKMGVYTIKLEKIEQRTYPDKNNGGTYDKLLWMFDTVEERKANDYPFRVFRRTGLEYGADRADLTKLITEIYGKRFTTAEYGDFDVQLLEGCLFKGVIGKETWNDGSEHNTLLSLEPVSLAELPWPAGVPLVDRPINRAPSNGTTPTGETAPMGLDNVNTADPQAEDPDGPPMTEAQIKALIKRMKLSEEEAKKMDFWGRMPGDEGYRNPDPFADQ